MVLSPPSTRADDRHHFSPLRKGFDIHVFQRLSGHPPIAMTCPQSAAGILPADLTLPGSGAMPEGFYYFRTADRIIIQFDIPAGWCDAALASSTLSTALIECSST
jgi:hypothetical protein